MMPHSMSSAAVPDAMGAAKEVPVTLRYPPPGAGAVSETPGARRSGLILPSVVGPMPEKSARDCLAESQAPTVSTLRAVPGIVTVVSGVAL